MESAGKAHFSALVLRTRGFLSFCVFDCARFGAEKCAVPHAILDGNVSIPSGIGSADGTPGAIVERIFCAFFRVRNLRKFEKEKNKS